MKLVQVIRACGLAFFALTFTSNSVFSQGVGIANTTITPDPQSILDVQSSTKGVLLPRLTTPERTTLTASLTAGDEGLTIYNKTTDLYNYWDGTQWIEMQTVAATTGAFVENQNATDQSADFRLSGDGTIQSALGVGTVAAGGTARTLIHDASATANELLLLVRDNASLPVFSVQDIGRVGVNTSAPISALDVVGKGVVQFGGDALVLDPGYVSGARLALGTIATPDQYLSLGHDGTNAYLRTAGNDFVLYSAATNPGLFFDEGNGNIGIGTSAPNQDLHVFRPDNDISRVYATGTTQGSGMFFAGQSPSYGGGFSYDGDGTPALVGGTDRITFFRRNNNTDTEVMSYAYSNSTVRVSSLAGTGTRLVLASAAGDLNPGGTLVGTGLGDNLGDHTATTDLNMNDYELRNVKALQGKDWDDNSGGTDNKYRLLFRDGAHQFYNGGVVVGSYGNGTWGDLADGTLIVEGNTGMGTTAPTQRLDVEGNLRLRGGIIDDDASQQGNSDDWMRLNGYIEMKSNTDNYGIVLRDKDNTNYFGLTQKDGWSYLSDSNTSSNYFLRGNGANAQVRGYLAVGNPTTGTTLKKGMKMFFEGGDHTRSSGTADYNFDFNLGQLDKPPGAGTFFVKSINMNMTALHREGDEDFHVYIDIADNNAGWSWGGGGSFGLSGNNQWMDWLFGTNANWAFTSNQTVQWEFYEENETCWLCDNESTTVYNVEAKIGYDYNSALQTGEIAASGRIYANNNIEVGDVAEYFPVSGDYETGDVISFIPGENNEYRRSSSSYDQFITGVISENPSVVLNNPDVGPPVALAGRVKVNIAPGHPPIKSGDFLTSSPIEGKAMKATKAGSTIGYATTNQNPGEGFVEIMVQPGKFYIPPPAEGSGRIQYVK